MDDLRIEEALKEIRRERRLGISADELIADWADELKIPKSTLANRYKIKYAQNCQEEPPPIKNIELPTLRESMILAAQRKAKLELSKYKNLSHLELNGMLIHERHTYAVIGYNTVARQLLVTRVDNLKNYYYSKKSSTEKLKDLTTKRNPHT